jgi:hypothetical protein
MISTKEDKMSERDVELKRTWQLLKSNVLKYAKIENMLMYLTPRERRVLCHILTGKVKKLEQYESVEELYGEISKGAEADTEDARLREAKLMRDKLFHLDFMNTYPYNIHLDLRDKFQSGMYLYSQLLYKTIYRDIREYHYCTLKPNYYYYEKFLREHLFEKLRPDNTYFNLLFLQGLLTEMKEEPNLLKEAENGLLRPILMEKIYTYMIMLRREDEGFEYDALTKAYEEAVPRLIEEAEDKKNKIIVKLKEENRKANEKLNLYMEKIKLYQNNSNDSLIEKIYENIGKKEDKISELQKTVETLKETERKKVQSLNREKEELAARLAELERVVDGLKEQLKETEEERLYLHVKHYIDKFGIDKVTALLPQKETAVSEEKIEAEAEQEKKEEIVNQTKLGYVTLTADGIMVVTPTGMCPVQNIPEKSLVGEGQFIRVDGNNNFINSYHYYTQFKVVFNSGLRFGEIQHLDGIPFVNMGSCIKKAQGLNRTVLEGQIVMADMSGNVKTFFKRMRFNLDYYYEIIKYYGMDLWRVVHLLEGVCIIESLEKKGQTIYKIPDNLTVKQNDILMLKEEELINVFDFKFFSYSGYYENSIRGTAEVYGETCLLVKTSGEKLIVNNIPENLRVETGDILIMDEYCNFIRTETGSSEEIAGISRKKKFLRTNDKFKMKQFYVEKKILIVGNPSYHQSYLLNLLKSGYAAETIDGFQPFGRILKASKKADIIIVLVNYISHDNMWLIKDNLKDIPVLYPDSDGAARILECLERYYEKDTVTAGVEEALQG